MIVLRSPKGWTCPPLVDSLRVEGSFRAHQVPFGDMDKPAHLALLEQWLRSYRPDELFDADGRLRADIAELAPVGQRRMSANPVANGGMLLKPLALPDFRDYALALPEPGALHAESTRVQGLLIRDVLRLNAHNFRGV